MSMKNEIRTLIHSHLREKCVTIGSGSTGSENNEKAQDNIS
jgi:hypothetical protein